MMRRFWLLAVVLLGIFAMGCAPPWTVIKQAEPNPFVGKREFAVLPVEYEGLRVGEKTEEEYKASKEDKTVGRFEEDKEKVATTFVANLQAEAQDEDITVTPAAGEVTGYVVRPLVKFMEPGFFAAVVSKPSKIVMRVRLEDKDGKVLDEIEIEHETATKTMGGGLVKIPVGDVSAGQRWTSDAEELGKYAALYLIHRVTGDCWAAARRSQRSRSRSPRRSPRVSTRGRW